MHVSRQLTPLHGFANLVWPKAEASIEASWLKRMFRYGECVLASVAVLVGAIIWSQPDEVQDAALSASKTRPGFASDPALAKDGEVIVSAYTGAPYTYPSDVVFKAPGKYDFTAKNVEWLGEPFDNPIYYGLRIARWGAATRTGWMLDFTHSKAIAVRDQILDLEGTLGGKPAPTGKKIKEVLQKLEASHGHNMLTLNGLLRFASFGARYHPYVGLGGGVSLPHSEIHFTDSNTRTYEYQYAGLAGQALVGLEIRFARTSYFLEYKFTLAPYNLPLTERNGSYLFFDLWRQFQDWWQGKEPPGGRMTTTYASHQVIGGIGVRMVPTAVPVQ